VQKLNLFFAREVREMKTRIITAIVLLCLFVPIVCLSDTVIFAVAAGVVCCFGVYEYLRCIGCKEKHGITVPACLISFAVVFFAHYSGGSISYILIPLACCASFMFYLFAYAVFLRGLEKFSEVASAFTGFFYITLAFVCLVVLSRMPNGRYIFLLAFVGAWVTDTFAYFTGYFFGRHKLIEEVSPKKTVEGSIGGIIFCVAAFMLYGFIIVKTQDVSVNYIALAVCAFFVSVISQIGDLVFSLVKREHGVKDYGKIFPGHGGVLDRFDSVIPVSVVIIIVISLSERFSFFA
jgi:phosphatidate cytidylyltransferase